MAFTGALMLGGVVKGALGVGLPLVAVPLLSLVLPAPHAIGSLVVPVLGSNLGQAVRGGRWLESLHRFGFLISAQVLATVLTVRLTLSLPTRQLDILLAFALLASVAMVALKPAIQPRPEHANKVGILVGLFAGMLAGVSSLTGPAIISYLTALKLDREAFVRSISIIYLCGALPLYAAMLAFGSTGWKEVSFSAAAVLPTAVGLFFGTMLRSKVGELLFRRALLLFLTVISVVLLIR